MKKTEDQNEKENLEESLNDGHKENPEKTVKDGSKEHGKKGLNSRLRNNHDFRYGVIAVICCFILVAVSHIVTYRINANKLSQVKVGFIYVGDSCNAYTNNFIKAEEAIALEFQDLVEIDAKYNVAEGTEEKYLRELAEEGCNIIFSTSYGYENSTKEIAEEYPDIEFCMATGDIANDDPVLPNFHTFMGEIYQGRYISGVVAGMKMQELIEDGKITEDQARVGYVAAFPYAEVISGYTAFLLGIRSVVPNATMTVIYTDSWGDYDLEKQVAERLIDEGCVIISQHSDTAGPASACEEAIKDHIVYHVGYNQSMSDIAPTTSLISSRIDWEYYMVEAVDAVLEGKSIEKTVVGNVYGNDISGGFDVEWVEMLKLNETIAADGTQEMIDNLITEFEYGKDDVFTGNYIGVDPFDPSDTYDLNNGYIENEYSSAPSFHYVLKDIITVEE